MIALVSNYRRLIACLAIALQVAGALVSGLGHTHYGDAACCSGSVCRAKPAKHHHSGSACSHGHAHSNAESPPVQPASDSHRPGTPHDDCSLCRHFSEPASPVTLIVDVPECDCSQSLDADPVEQLSAAAVTAHPARGPPALCA